jgi:hypothetical protein
MNFCLGHRQEFNRLITSDGKGVEKQTLLFTVNENKKTAINFERKGYLKIY